MERWRVGVAAMCLIALGAMAQDDDYARVKKIILHSQPLGAHGMGYNRESLEELAKTLRAGDLPALIRLLRDREMRVGAQFGLASQCGAAIDPVRRATSEKGADIHIGEDVMQFIMDNSACSEQARQDAEQAKSELAELRKTYWQKRADELAAERTNDQRIQQNAMKITDPKRSGELTKEERMEAFQRSVKAAGLENPQTPEQKALVDRMYRTMVLGESNNKKKPN